MTEKRALPAGLTSYDLIKAAAVIIMIADHVGYYFFPENEWWRAFGRIGFPVWFFFVGHASGRDLSWKLWGGALVLTVANFVVGLPFFALNALVTIIAIRLFLDPVMSYARQSVGALARVFVLLIILALPSGMVTEYGTMGLIFAVFGYIVRHKDDFMPERKILFPVMIASFASFAVMQQLVFGFTSNAFLFMAAGTLGTCVLMMSFKAREFPGLTARTPAFFRAPVQWMGRHTLEIYVIHLLAFKAAAAILYPALYPLFHFRLFMGG